MKLYAPAYYPEFACIADRCRHSCCIGWEIDVDTDTYAFYKTLNGDYAAQIQNSIDPEGVPHFILAAHDRCPHLDEQGLCRIIRAYGEGALCEICQEHPRFYHDTPHGKEVGLGLSCEEACRIVLGSDSYAFMVEIGELDAHPDTDAFDATSLRKHVYDLLGDTSLSYNARLSRIGAAFGVRADVLSDDAWCELLCQSEYLHQEHRKLFMLYSADADVLPTQELILARALAYFVYRHCSDAACQADFAASLGLALFLERLLASLIAAGYDALDAARIISEELEYSEDNTETIRSVFY